MTEEERTAFKAEIVSELGQHLDEHFVKAKGLEERILRVLHGDVELGKGIALLLDTVVGDLPERMRHVEIFLALQDLHRGVEPTDAKKWMMLARIRDDYGKKIRQRIASYFKDSQAKFGLDGVREGIKKFMPDLHELFKVD